jgi:hypothetical protein
MSEQTIDRQQAYDGSTLLKSVAQEVFTDKIVEGLSQYEAYLAVYQGCKSEEVARAASSRLLTKVNIKARIDYKRAKIAAKMMETFEITKEGQAKKLEDCRQRCINAGDGSTEVAAIREQDKLFGLSIDVLDRPDAERELDSERQRLAEEAARALMDKRLHGCSSGCSDGSNSEILEPKQA